MSVNEFDGTNDNGESFSGVDVELSTLPGRTVTVKHTLLNGGSGELSIALDGAVVMSSTGSFTAPVEVE